MCGVYRAEEGEYARGIGPELCLYPNREGSFHAHSASSYIASGTYKVDGGKVILTDEFSDEPQDIYTFEIADDKLIFWRMNLQKSGITVPVQRRMAWCFVL